jgi:hypothetical protein
MLNEEAPVCFCGTRDWQGGGGSFGVFSQQWMTCKDCGRSMGILFAYSNGAVFQHRERLGNINEFSDWLNNTLLVTFRAAGEEIEKARTHVWETALAKYLKDRPDATKDETRNLFHKITSTPEYRRPPGFEPPIPANIPDNMYLRLLKSNDEYELVTSEQSRGLETPPDPIRVRHDEYYLPILEQFGLDYELIPNEYCGAANEPWYKLNVGGVEIKIGPRKRVTSIIVNAPQGMGVVTIAKAAKDDQTTYFADSVWQSNAEIARNLEVHAWTNEKIKEYLAILIKEITNGNDEKLDV